MNEYLGICMVVVVIGIVIAVLSRLMTGNILDEIDRIKQRRFERRINYILKAIERSTDTMSKYIKYAKEAIELDKNTNKEVAQKAAKESLEKTINEEFEKTLK